MNIKEVFPSIEYDFNFFGISSDSRMIKEGDIFAPIQGEKYCGYEFINDAIFKKAVAILSNTEIKGALIPVIIVKNVKEATLLILDKLYQNPCKDICLIGVTGTDGKTTTSTLCSYILNYIKPASYIGTNGVHDFNGYIDISTSFTTPPLTLNYYLLDLVGEKTNFVCMEVSSEGIKNGRIEGLQYDYAIFTNLSHEHLNTHQTMTSYFLQKLKLFNQMKKNGIRIINADDPYSEYFSKMDNVITYSLFRPSLAQAKNIQYHEYFTTFDFYYKDKIFKNIKINRCEEYNIYNIIPGIIIAIEENINITDLYYALSHLPNVLGRLEKVPTYYDFDVYVDFAHTPNGLKAVLSSLQNKKKKRLILVCGCAGKKDKTKRPIMGKIAVEYSDYVIFTSEDPKNEEPEEIINDMLEHVVSNNYEIIINRKLAILRAINIAQKNDIVIVTGKGREKFFEEKGKVYKYSDYDFLLSIKNKDIVA